MQSSFEGEDFSLNQPLRWGLQFPIAWEKNSRVEEYEVAERDRERDVSSSRP